MKEGNEHRIGASRSGVATALAQMEDNRNRFSDLRTDPLGHGADLGLAAQAPENRTHDNGGRSAWT